MKRGYAQRNNLPLYGGRGRTPRVRGLGQSRHGRYKAGKTGEEKKTSLVSKRVDLVGIRG